MSVAPSGSPPETRKTTLNMLKVHTAPSTTAGRSAGRSRGRISSRRVNPSVIVLVPGSHRSPKTKIAARNTELANSGTEVVMMLETEITRSSFDPSRMPARIPRVRDTGMRTTNTPSPRIAVFRSRGPRMSATGALKRTDCPKSPTTKCPSQRRYLS